MTERLKRLEDAMERLQGVLPSEVLLAMQATAKLVVEHMAENLWAKARRQLRLLREEALPYVDASPKVRSLVDLVNKMISDGDKVHGSTIAFVEQKKVYFYESAMPPVQTSNVLTSFVSQKVNQTYGWKLSSLYTQCIRCIKAPTTDFQDANVASLLEWLCKSFKCDQEFHLSSVAAEKDYDKTNLVALLNAQLSELDSHPFYSEESFKISKHYLKWKDRNKTRLETLLSGLPKSDKECLEPTIFGVKSEGFLWLLQLYISLGCADACTPSTVGQHNTCMYRLEKAVEKEILHKPFCERYQLTKLIGKYDIPTLVGHSPYSEWLIGEFCTRSCISTLYRQTTLLKYITTAMQPTLSNYIVAQTVLQAVMGILKERDMIMNTAEATYVYSTVKDIISETESVLSKIFHHFYKKNMSALGMAISFLTSLYDVRIFMAERGGKAVDGEKYSSLKSLETCLRKSFSSYYSEARYSVESKVVDSWGRDIDRLSTEKPTFMKNRTATPLQLSNLIGELLKFIKGIEVYTTYLQKGVVKENIKETMLEVFYSTLQTELKFFVRKDVKEFRARANVQLAVRWFQFLLVVGKPKEEIAHALSPYIPQWLTNYKRDTLAYITSTASMDGYWKAVDPTRPYNSTARLLCTELEENLELVASLENCSEEFGLDENISAQYQSAFLHIVNLYLEYCYNTFVEEEFPQQLHPTIHDIYLKSNFHLSNTNSDSRKRMLDFLRTSTGITKGDKEEPHLKIRVNSPVLILSDKKMSKYWKNRPRVAVTDQMCVKIQCMETVRCTLNYLRTHNDRYEELCEKLLLLQKSIYNSCVGGLVAVMELYVSNELFHIAQKSKKKLQSKSYKEMLYLEQYVVDNFLLLQKYFNILFIEKFAIRFVKAAMKALIAHADAGFSIYQICMLECFVEDLKGILVHLPVPNPVDVGGDTSRQIPNLLEEALVKLLKGVDSSYYEYRNNIFKQNKETSFGKEAISLLSTKLDEATSSLDTSTSATSFKSSESSTFSDVPRSLRDKDKNNRDNTDGNNSNHEDTNITTTTTTTHSGDPKRRTSSFSDPNLTKSNSASSRLNIIRVTRASKSSGEKKKTLMSSVSEAHLPKVVESPETGVDHKSVD